MRVRPGRWNHNIHHHPMIVAAIPVDAQVVLDAGCGEGTLARTLAQRFPAVVGIDSDADSVAAAAGNPGPVRYVRGDVLSHPFEPGSFDAVVSVATLHHLDARAALTRFVELLRPGGTLVVLGCARSVGPADLLWELAGMVAHQVLRRRREFWEHPSPKVWPPAVTYREMHDLADRLLVGSRYRRHLLWRYSIVWTKPVG